MANRETRRASASDEKRGANAKGVVKLDLGFRTLKLKVTLAAMADCEDEFGVDFNDIETVFTGTRAIAKFIGILARAGGEEVTDEDLEKIRRAPIGMSDLIENLRMAAGGDATPQPEAPSPGA